jgi:cold shock protein
MKEIKMQGTVVNYNRAGGWGFIVPDDPNTPDLFVHYTFIQTNSAQRFLKVGQRVEFAPFDLKGKPQARHVVKLPDVLAVR